MSSAPCTASEQRALWRGRFTATDSAVMRYKWDDEQSRLVVGGWGVWREEWGAEERNEGKHQLFFQVMHLRIHSCPFNPCLLLYHQAFWLLMFTVNQYRRVYLIKRSPRACWGLYKLLSHAILLRLSTLLVDPVWKWPPQPSNYVCQSWTNTSIRDNQINRKSWPDVFPVLVLWPLAH